MPSLPTWTARQWPLERHNPCSSKEAQCLWQLLLQHTFPARLVIRPQTITMPRLCPRSGQAPLRPTILLPRCTLARITPPLVPSPRSARPLCQALPLPGRFHHLSTLTTLRRSCPRPTSPPRPAPSPVWRRHSFLDIPSQFTRTRFRRGQSITRDPGLHRGRPTRQDQAEVEQEEHFPMYSSNQATHYPHQLTLRLPPTFSMSLWYLSEQFYGFHVIVVPVVGGVPAETDEYARRADVRLRLPWTLDFDQTLDMSFVICSLPQPCINSEPRKDKRALSCTRHNCPPLSRGSGKRQPHMQDALDYKTAKEGFVANQNGSTLNHINLISLVALTSLSFYSTLRVRTNLLPSSSSLSLFLAQFLLLVGPLLVAVTLAAKPPGWDTLKVNLLFTGAAVTVYVGTKERIARNRTSLPHSTKIDQTVDNGNRRSESGKIAFLPSVTTWRAHMMLMTSLCILAVDFPVFPRELAKCETFGVSLVCLETPLTL